MMTQFCYSYIYYTHNIIHILSIKLFTQQCISQHQSYYSSSSSQTSLHVYIRRPVTCECYEIVCVLCRRQCWWLAVTCRSWQDDYRQYAWRSWWWFRWWPVRHWWSKFDGWSLFSHIVFSLIVTLYVSIAWQAGQWILSLTACENIWKESIYHDGRDVPDIWFRLAGYPVIFSNPVPVPAKTVPGTGYLSRIVLSPLWQLVELSSPSKCAPYCKTVSLHDSLVVSHVDQLFYIY